MPEQTQYLTTDGFRELEARLEHLRTVRRAEVAARLHQALEEGGELVENAEYEDAKNEQERFHDQRKDNTDNKNDHFAQKKRKPLASVKQYKFIILLL